MSDIRLNQLHTWAQDALNTPLSITPVSGDASFRRYFRVLDEQTNRHFIAMDAPPEKENSAPFVDICRQLEKEGVPVPHIEALDLSQGFMLLEDFGDVQLLSQLNDNSADNLYGKSLDVLLNMQKNCTHSHLPAYDTAMLQREMDLLPDWFINQHLSLTLSEAEETALRESHQHLIDNALSQPQVFVHRDFHSRNLMLCDDAIGVIDFQDAVSGPITYDIVSLLRDCYIDWPKAKLDNWLGQYHQQLLEQQLIDADFTTFKKWFDLMGIQRHMKAVGIFARLNHRDNKPGYLGDIPRTLKYIVDVSAAYPTLSGLHALSQSLLTKLAEQ